uniref:Uncharacterized protein n=1 Tax=Ananas comosus var. bracteatus TaxID=296719 RepID=A0A6V7PPT7_ANACO|nr:unnamed protein product [Ananas comosus var. bracteatus]
MSTYSVPIENKQGSVSVYVDMDVRKGDNVVEFVGCWSAPCANIDQVEEEAARRSVGKLCDEFAFKVRDFNLENKKSYDNLYEQLSTDHSMLKKKYKQLKNDYNLLWGYYNDLLAEKDRYVIERRKLKESMDRCVALLDRPDAITVNQNSNSRNSDKNLMVLSSYEN